MARIARSSASSRPSPISRSHSDAIENGIERLAGALAEPGAVDALGEAKAEDDELRLPLPTGEVGRRRARPLPFASTASSQRCGRRCWFSARVAPSTLQPPLRPRADRQVVLAAPDRAVVAALLAGRGVVGDLVSGQAGAAEPLLGQLEQLGSRLAVRLGHAVAVEGGAGDDGELVDGEVAHREVQRPVELARPVGRRLPGNGVDQVERDAAEDAKAPPRWRGRRLGGVGAAEEAQDLVVERLDADGEAIDAGVAEGAEAAGFAGGRVGLQGDLAVLGRRSIGRARGVDDGGDVAGSISDGVPPPKKIEPTCRPARLGRERLDLADQRPAPALARRRRLRRGC